MISGQFYKIYNIEINNKLTTFKKPLNKPLII